MAQEFLHAAEQILRQHKEPMLIKDILQMALDGQLLESSGKTPINTMRARLAEHIKNLGKNSIFIRVDPNKFALREWDYKEYKSKPLEKNTKNEIVVCIHKNIVDRHKKRFGFSPRFEPFLRELSDFENLVVLPRSEAKKRADIKQLVSYVLLKDNKGRLLSFVRGNYGQKESLLQGVLCLGFGGHVNQIDIDLFGIIDAGIMNSAYREIAEEIKGLKMSNLRHIGVINDDSSPLGLNHFAFVFEAHLPTSFTEKSFSKEKAISKLSLLNRSAVWERFHELEFWSQLLVKALFPKSKTYNPVFIKTKFKRFDKDPLVVVGEIGSGKSEVCEHLAKKFKLPLVSTRKCVEKLIPADDFETENRKDFQDEAIKLVSSKGGIERLVKEIISEMNNYTSECIVIDGIRNLETFNQLKAKFPSANLLYIDVPRDTAFHLFSSRSGGRKVSIDEFREARHHDVEKEITLFKTRADAYLFNGGNLKDLYKAINDWWHERNKI
jgi:predicted NUDIX family phosphoesterase/adenylate kinase family enzyme